MNNHLNKSIKQSDKGYYLLDEKQIVSLYKSGKTAKEIAQYFGISVPTVKRRIRKNNAQRGPKYSLNENAFSVFTKESCYWAGFIAADAWVGSNHIKKKIYIELSNKDKKHLEKLCAFLDREALAVKNKISKIGTKEYLQSVLEIGNKKIVRDLVKNFNIIQRKSFTLQPPNKIPENLVSSYIRGYFDGDGYIGKNEPIFNVVSGSYDILYWIRQKIKNKFDIDINILKQNNILHIQTSCNKALKILNWIYSGSTTETRLNRKYDRYINFVK